MRIVNWTEDDLKLNTFKKRLVLVKEAIAKVAFFIF